MEPSPNASVSLSLSRRESSGKRNERKECPRASSRREAGEKDGEASIGNGGEK